ncbi:MAG: G5 domain-containing protein [Actinomycetaceae bacterium]|nr:G5 domain-containing protein [Actinomycetaceae bacterium]
MGRHTASQGEAFEFKYDLSKTPAPGSRRAARLAERGDGRHTASGYGEGGVAVATMVDENVHQFRPDIPVYTGESQAERGDIPEEVVAAGAKSSRFSLFNRSRATVAAVVAAATGVGTLVTASLANPEHAEARTLIADGKSSVDSGADNVVKATFKVEVDGETREVTSSKATLGEALTEAGIELGADDQVSEDLAAPVTDGETVVITRVEKKLVSEEVVVAHESSEVEDSSLAKGEREVQTEGVDGVTSNTYEVTYVNGQEQGRDLVVSAEKSSPVNEVVKVGTAEQSEASSAQAASQDTSASAAAADTSQAAASAEAPAAEAAAPAASGDPKSIARSMLSSYGWGDGQYQCLVSLWEKESNWNYQATNKSSGAYGIPQSLPASKMASAGADWRTNPATQIRWGLGYIQGRYGSPCAAWSHSQSVGWY